MAVHHQAVLTNEGSRRASVTQGNSLLRLAVEAFGLIGDDDRAALQAIRRTVSCPELGSAGESKKDQCAQCACPRLSGAAGG
jgi:hypothetical protein